MADRNNDNEQPNISGVSTTPLLFLLDGVLSQDEERVRDAVHEIARLVPHLPAVTVMTTAEQQQQGNAAAAAAAIAATAAAIAATAAAIVATANTVSSSSPCSTTSSSTALGEIVSCLLQAHPEFASMRSEHDGSLPLHFCASLGNVPVAHMILQKYPQAASAPNQKGKIALHYAAREGRIDMVRYFLHVAPETAAIATDKGKLAVHFAAGDGHAAITSALLQQYPQSAALPSTKGKLPLHFCARWGYLEIAHELLGVYPDAVRALDWEGSLPLHDAAREGQYRMARYLIERFPVALQTANLRGEIPLFPAVRSANVDLVTLMIQAWPMGGKHILRNVSADDNVASWNWGILELLLRGAVNNLRGCALLQGREPPTVRLTDDVQPVAVASSEELKAQKEEKKAAAKQSSSNAAAAAAQQQQQPRLVEAPHRWAPAAVAAPPFASLSSSFSPVVVAQMEKTTASLSAFAASIPVRSKSPILGSGCDFGNERSSDGRKKAKDVRKRSRQMSVDDGVVERTFIPLHAAFESKAASHVIQHVLQEQPEDVTRIDERGRHVLHWAVTHCHNQDAIVELVLNHHNTNSSAILTPEAARAVDSTGKLPLHLAIANRADVRIISALLEAHPAAGVEPCRTMDRFFDKTPLHMATHYGCDLSTVFVLLRVDPSFVANRG